MIPSNPKLAGPVKYSSPDSDTVILTCDRSLKWPVIFDSGSGESPFVWHLTAITVDGRSHRLTWHFDLKPMLLAGEEAARITGKPLRVERDALKSSTWNRWGYNFLC
jgi:hypothetical protein